MGTVSTDTPAVDMAAERARSIDKRAEEWATARARMLLGRVRASDEPTTLREAAQVEWPSFTAEARCRIVERALELERSGDGSRHIDPATVGPIAPPEPPEGRRRRTPTLPPAKVKALRDAIGALIRENPAITARQVHARLSADGFPVATIDATEYHVTAMRFELGVSYPKRGGRKPKTEAPTPEISGKSRKKPAAAGQVAQSRNGAAAHPHDPNEVSPGEGREPGSGVRVDVPASGSTVTLGDVLAYEAEHGEAESQTGGKDGSRTEGGVAAQPASGVLGAAPGEPRRGDPQSVAEDLDAPDRAAHRETHAPTGVAGDRVAPSASAEQAGVEDLIPMGEGGRGPWIRGRSSAADAAPPLSPHPPAENLVEAGKTSQGWTVWRNATEVECPECGFCMSANMLDMDHEGEVERYTCPLCTEIAITKALARAGFPNEGAIPDRLGALIAERDRLMQAAPVVATGPARPSIEAYQRGDGTWSVRATGPIGFIWAVVATIYGEQA